MLISTLLAWHILLSPLSFATENPVCKSLFEDSKNLPALKKVFEHLKSAESLSHGTPDHAPLLVLDATSQLRFYTEPSLSFYGSQSFKVRALKLETAVLIGEVSAAELPLIEAMYPAGSLITSPARVPGAIKVMRWVPVRTIPVDLHTGLPRGDTVEARNIISEYVRLSKKEDGNAILFLDLDFLNMVNSLPNGHAGGDRYISTTLNIISENVRFDRGGRQDVGFRIGGDEFLLILRNVDNNKLSEIQNRIYEAFRQDARLKYIIDEAYNQYEYFLSRLSALKSYQELQKYPEVHDFIIRSETWGAYSSRQQQAVVQDPQAFVRFMQTYLTSNEVKVRGEVIRSIQPGASLAGLMIDTGSTFNGIMQKADQMMQNTKKHRKDAGRSGLQSEVKGSTKEGVYFPVADFLQ